MVADISAGPCSYGRVGAPEGVIGPFTLPRLRRVIIPRWKTALAREETKRVRNAKFRGQLSTLVMSAVQHLIAPDIRCGFAGLLLTFSVGLTRGQRERFGEIAVSFALSPKVGSRWRMSGRRLRLLEVWVELERFWVSCFLGEASLLTLTSIKALARG